MTRLNKYILGLLLALGSTLPILAQNSGDGYNPDNPAEPGNINEKLNYKVSVVLGTEGAGTVSGGCYKKHGTTTTISATAITGYKFAYWLKNDETEPYNTAATFIHTITEDVKFTAIYERLHMAYAKINDEKAGKVSAVVRYTDVDSEASFSTTANKDYKFEYWVKDGETEPYSTEPSFVYPIGDNEWEVNFTAIYKYVYNPESPSEPSDIDHKVMHNVNVSINDPRAGSVSGAGRYTYGTVVTLKTSGAVGYRFVRWTKDGKPYSTDPQITYTVGIEDANFVAEYVNIAEELEEYGHAVYFQAEPIGSCTFDSQSGQRYMPEATFTVTAVPGTDEVFDGWYMDGTLVGTTLTYGSYVQDKDINLVAKFHYDPGNPDEPTNPGGYVEEVEKEGLLGDVNGDEKVTVADAVAIIAYYLQWTEASEDDKLYDINKDGKVTVADAIMVIGIYLSAN